MATPKIGSLFSPRFVERTFETETGPQVLRFYPISMRAALMLRSVSGPLAKAFSTFFGKSERRDTGETYERTKDDQGFEFTKTRVEAISPELAAFRAKQREDAVNGLISAFTSDDNVALLGHLLTNSMREIFPRNVTLSPAEALGFVQDLEGAILVEMLEAFYEANAKQFGPLVERVIRKMRSEMTRVTADEDAADSTSPTSNSGDASTTPSLKP